MKQIYIYIYILVLKIRSIYFMIIYNIVKKPRRVLEFADIYIGYTVTEVRVITTYDLCTS